MQTTEINQLLYMEQNLRQMPNTPPRNAFAVVLPSIPAKKISISSDGDIEPLRSKTKQCSPKCLSEMDADIIAIPEAASAAGGSAEVSLLSNRVRGNSAFFNNNGKRHTSQHELSDVRMKVNVVAGKNAMRKRLQRWKDKIMNSWSKNIDAELALFEEELNALKTQEFSYDDKVTDGEIMIQWEELKYNIWALVLNLQKYDLKGAEHVLHALGDSHELVSYNSMTEEIREEFIGFLLTRHLWRFVYCEIFEGEGLAWKSTRKYFQQMKRGMIQGMTLATVLQVSRLTKRCRK